MLRALFVLLVFALPAKAEEKKVAITFLGGAKNVPLEGLKVTIRGYTGDWTEDLKNKLKDGKTDKNGQVGFALADGHYYVDIVSEKEVPYLSLPVGYKQHTRLYDRRIKVGKETAFEFNLADACKLTLRAVDADTGKGIPNVCFVTESETAEDWGIAIVGDNLGADHKKQCEELTDKDGYLIRYMGPREGYTYFAWPSPEGYKYIGKPEVTIPTPIGADKAEQVFKYKKK